MKTNTHPGDYERNQPIIPQPVQLCIKCGGFMVTDSFGRRCFDCGGHEYELVMEGTPAEEYRKTKRQDLDATPDTLAEAWRAAESAYAAEPTIENRKAVHEAWHAYHPQPETKHRTP